MLKKILIASLFIVAIALGVYYFENRQVVEERSQNEVAGSVDTTDWKTYRDDKYGFSFYYPNSWFINDDSNGTVLTNFGPYKDDRLIVRRVEGNKVVVQDAKFGDTTLYFDEGLKKWMKTTPNNQEEYTTVQVEPSFYTISGLPVFSSTGRWRTYIVPLSHTRFLIVNITGSGWTSVIEPFAKSIVGNVTSINNLDIKAIVEEERNSENK